MKLVIIESPYAGKPESWEADVAANVEYLQRCIRDCLARDESPYASHQMLTSALDDRVPEQRAQGIAAGLEFRRRVDLRAFYIDRGWSGGMKAARALYDKEGLAYEIRTLPFSVRSDQAAYARAIESIGEPPATLGQWRKWSDEALRNDWRGPWRAPAGMGPYIHSHSIVLNTPFEVLEAKLDSLTPVQRARVVWREAVGEKDWHAVNIDGCDVEGAHDNWWNGKAKVSRSSVDRALADMLVAIDTALAKPADDHNDQQGDRWEARVKDLEMHLEAIRELVEAPTRDTALSLRAITEALATMRADLDVMRARIARRWGENDGPTTVTVQP